MANINPSTEQLQKYANEVIANFVAPVNNIIQYVLSKTDVGENGCTFNLTTEELYTIAIKLPAECSFLQSQINAQIIKQKTEAFLTQTRITESVTLLQNTKGDAKERQRRAEAMVKNEVLGDIISEQIVAALQATIIRADKVYEGIKKVIDAKSREFGYDAKPGKSVAV